MADYNKGDKGHELNKVPLPAFSETELQEAEYYYEKAKRRSLKSTVQKRADDLIFTRIKDGFNPLA
jgi:hypothetical protein